MVSERPAASDCPRYLTPGLAPLVRSLAVCRRSLITLSCNLRHIHMLTPRALPCSAAAEADSKRTRKTGRKSIAKLSRKQKIRKKIKADRAETLADRAEVKAHRDNRKTAFRLKAKTLW